ncbi:MULTISPECIES: hypothetical protein [unclassified Yoonia]|uniref:hypothetical protein n=1 Tax=unclassified Yoonia TaxID=2629118 RepID=UPI002AFFCDC1|nr:MULTISPECIES: hypothetical protein [unclassified Yoonia]
MTMTIVSIYRWLVFLLAAGYCIRTLVFGGYDAFGGPFRFLTIWALFMSFFAASRMMALMEGRSYNRWDGFVCMTAVINTMVVMLYWRLYFADPTSVTPDGQLAAWHLEIYLHLVGPLLQVIDTIFVHRSYRRLGPALVWLVGVIVAYVGWAEFLVGPMNDTPIGSVTSGLPYPFLNNLELSERMVFYTTNLATGLVLLFVYAGIALIVRRRLPAPAMP